MGIHADALTSLVSITQFNKGQAAKIFERLKDERQIIVLKNNKPAAILLSPEEYLRIIEAEERLQEMLHTEKTRTKGEAAHD
jgi:PHD/YefM family antitoxin component YafN of YafNO toxin-antitoxin module